MVPSWKYLPNTDMNTDQDHQSLLYNWGWELSQQNKGVTNYWQGAKWDSKNMEMKQTLTMEIKWHKQKNVISQLKLTGRHQPKTGKRIHMAKWS